MGATVVQAATPVRKPPAPPEHQPTLPPEHQTTGQTVDSTSPATPLRMSIISQPGGAEVFVDGSTESAGTTPYIVTIADPERPVAVVLKKEGYDDTPINIDSAVIKGQQNGELTVKLEKNPPRKSHEPIWTE